MKQTIRALILVMTDSLSVPTHPLTQANCGYHKQTKIWNTSEYACHMGFWPALCTAGITVENKIFQNFASMRQQIKCKSEI